jgi:hypothetical protein
LNHDLITDVVEGKLFACSSWATKTLVARPFSPFYGVAWKASCKLVFPEGRKARDYAFEFLKKLPYEISTWRISTWDELKANVIADICTLKLSDRQMDELMGEVRMRFEGRD